MGRDTGAGAARLERLLGATPDRSVPGDGEAGRTPDDDEPGWVDLVGAGGSRHSSGVPPVRGSGWRPAGVPTGAAVAAVAVAVVVAVLLLGSDGGADEVVVAPASPTDPSAAAGPVTGPAAGRADAQPTADLTGPAGSAADPGGPASSTPAPSAPLVVHVDGAVVRPGVVTVPAGSRVSDAVAAAGGVRPDADTRLVNLARPLADGELVLVPVPGEVPAPVGGAAGAGASGDGAAAAPGAAPAVGGQVTAGAVDLNAADAATLDALPGIGPVLAQRIVAHRDEVGAFGSVDELDAVSGIGPALMTDLRDLVTV